MENSLEDVLKAQSSILPQRNAVEQLFITSCKMTMHAILSPVGLLAHALNNVWLWNTQLHWLCRFDHKRLYKQTL